MKKIFTAFILFVAIISGCSITNTWELTSGNLFEGKAVLEGWGVEVPYYNGEPELHFHVDPESIKKLPKDFDFSKYDWNFKLENYNDSFLKVLSESTSNDKIEVVADKITIPQEGHPLMHITGTGTDSRPTSPQTQ